MTTEDRIQKQIDLAEGSARKRCLTVDDILQLKNFGDGVYKINGGGVANSYRYPAESTYASVIVRHGKIFVRYIWRDWAKKGSYGRTPRIQRRCLVKNGKSVFRWETLSY